MEYPPRKEYHDNDGRNKYFLEKHNIRPYNDHGNRADYDGMVRYHHTLSDNKNSYEQWIKYAEQAGNCIDQWATEFGIPEEVIEQDEPYLRWVFTLYDLAWRNPPGYSCKAKITSGSFIDTVLREVDGEPFVFDSDISDLVEYSIRAVDYLTRGYQQQQLSSVIVHPPKHNMDEPAESPENTHGKKTSRGVRKKKDNHDLLIAVLCRHHRHGTEEFNHDPIDTTLAIKLSDGLLSKSSISRSMKKSFGSKRGYNTFCTRGVMKEKLDVLTGEGLQFTTDPEKLEAVVEILKNDQ